MIPQKIQKIQNEYNVKNSKKYYQKYILYLAKNPLQIFSKYKRM